MTKYKIRYYSYKESPQFGGQYGVQAHYRKGPNKTKKTMLVFMGTWEECMAYVELKHKGTQ